MAGEWTQTTLGSIACTKGYGLVDGPFGSNLPASCYTDEGIPVIRGSNLTLGISRFRAHEFVFVSRDTAKRLERSLCRPLDIVFTKKGTLGQTGLVPEGGTYDLYLLSSNQMKLSVDRRVADPLFVYYVVSSPECTQKIIRDSESTGVPKTNVTYLRDFPIALPPLPEQRAIAHILGTLDDKIELNRRMNETLEAMARALFKSWFVDFDPVRAKHALSKVEGAEGRPSTSSGQAFPGLPKPLADLFPDSFEDSELGEIPKGWRVGSVDDEFNLTMGQSPPGETYNDAGVGLPFYQGCTDFGFRFPTRRIYCTAPARIGKAGDALVSVRAPVGDINMATEDCAIGRGVAAARHKTGSRSYTYQFMQSIEEVFARFEAEGTVFGSIGKKDFHAIACVNAPRELVLAYEARVSPLDDRVEVNERESRTLAVVRDTLLPCLISGELRTSTDKDPDSGQAVARSLDK